MLGLGAVRACRARLSRRSCRARPRSGAAAAPPWRGRRASRRSARAASPAPRATPPAGQPVRRALLESRPRSSSMRTVSTAYSGTPSARARICSRSVVGKPGHEAGQELLHRLLRQRLEVERGEAPLAGAPGRPPLQQFRPGQRDHEDRRASRPVEQVLDEVEQAGVGPLHVLEGEHRRIAVGQALEEEAPGREEILLVAGLVLGRARAGARAAARRTRAPRGRGCAPRAWRAAWPARRPAPPPPRCGSACAPCPRVPSTSRPRRRRGSVRGASTTLSAMPSKYL